VTDWKVLLFDIVNSCSKAAAFLIRLGCRAAKAVAKWPHRWSWLVEA
jgi:hypothetical protein